MPACCDGAYKTRGLSALKDLKELMDESAGEGEGIVIRIEGDVVPPEGGAGEECR